jgi:hypothetical protein
MNRKPTDPRLLGLFAVLHLGITALTWSDLRRRPATSVRGPKALWRALSALNTSGSVAYFLLGRVRGAHSS